MSRLKEIAATLRPQIEGRCVADFDLSRFTTYRLGGPAGLYLEPASIGDLEHLGGFLREADIDPPVLVLGRGSNLLISDEGFPGVIVRLGSTFSWARQRGERDLEVGAAMSMPQLANYSARRGLAGLEWAISIPGSVGGGVRMNAGAHGGEIKDRLSSVKVWRMDGLVLDELPAEALGMSYRRSTISATDVILEATFQLESEPEAAIRARMDAYRRHRAETQPGALQNAGSVFKNPEGDSAGRLVEAAGLKGFRVGAARVSDLHANFFIADEEATAQDVFDLISQVKTKVRGHSGVELETEIRFIGQFRETGEEG